MKTVLYLGDGPLNGPACYLTGALQFAGYRVGHYAAGEKMPSSLYSKKFGVIIISDYPRSEFPRKFMEWICREVRNGTGFLMIGGWASFSGVNGKYRASLIEEILPVQCLKGDDRKNLASGAVLAERKSSHPILKGIPLAPSPVVIGYNEVRAKKNANVILKLRENVSGIKNPLLVLGPFGKGKTAAFTTDAAPHWCGGLVDWGNKRLKVKVDQTIAIEVGNFYVKFFSQLVGWLY